MERLIGAWQFWAILAAVFAALTAIFGKLGVSEIHPDVAPFFRKLVMLSFLVLLLIATGHLGEVSTIGPKAIGFLVLSGLATGGSWLCNYRALKLGNASQVAPIDKLSVVLFALLAFAFLGERLSSVSWLGVAMIATGSILVSR